MKYSRRVSRCVPFVLALVLLSIGIFQPGQVRSVQAATLVGYRDFSFGTGVASPTAEKPQSKLWFNDGLWWGSLYNSSAGEYRIYWLDWGTQTWSDTGTRVDTREVARMDTLWDGTHLYIGSAGTDSSNSNHSARIMRYSYSSSTKSYSLDTGFPVTIVTGGMGALVIDKDSTGKVWATYVRGTNVYVTHTTTDDLTWLAPYVIPVSGATNLLDAVDGDMSAVVAFDTATAEPKIGVMWSNQNDDAMYFAMHTDGRPDSEWVVEPAVQMPGYADDHLNLKSLQADASGRVFAATKTSLTASEAPLILLLVKGTNGGWSRHTVARVKENHTRPIVLIDQQNRNLYVLMSSPCCSGGVVYYKQTPVDNISFEEGMGTPFIQSDTDLKINNVTSTKQTLNSATGLVVLASDNGSDYYLHNFMDFSSGADTTPPDTTIASGPSGTVNSTSASFTFSSSESNSSFECSLDGGTWESCTSPKEYAGLADGSHSFQVRAIDAAGNVDATPAERSWTVDTTGPAVISVVPADGATGVALTTNVSAAFSEPIDAATLSATTFTLVKQGTTTPVEAVVSYDSSTATARLDPSVSLDLGVIYTATVKGGSGGLTDVAGNALVSDNVWSFTTAASDTASPTVTLTSPMDGVTIGGSVTLAADATDDVAVDHVDFLVDGAVVATDGTSPYSVAWDSAGVADGTAVTITARAVDTSTNVTTSAAHTVTIDNAAPDTTIDSGPSGTLASNSAAFAFSSNEVGSSFECSLDGGTWESCTSPKEYTGLADGAHTFQVRATDAAGNTDLTPDSRSWAVDATAPDTTIDTKPSNPSNDVSPSFTFISSETGSTFECSLDGSAFVACTSPQEYAGLPDGAHTFQVRATDPVGNTDATPAGYTWTVDATAPAVAITSPSGGATVSGTVKVKASASDGSAVTKVRFYLDGKLLGTDESAPYEISWNTRKSTNGSHILYAQADDAAGNTAQSASVTVTVRN